MPHGRSPHGLLLVCYYAHGLLLVCCYAHVLLPGPADGILKVGEKVSALPANGCSNAPLLGTTLRHHGERGSATWVSWFFFNGEPACRCYV